LLNLLSHSRFSVSTIQSSIITVTIQSISGLEVKGVDDEGMILTVTKAHRIPDLKEGDLVQGYLLNDDENPDVFYLEAVQRVVTASRSLENVTEGGGIEV